MSACLQQIMLKFIEPRIFNEDLPETCTWTYTKVLGHVVLTSAD